MRETRAAAEVFAVPTASETLEDVARIARERLDAFLAEKDLGPDDVLALAMALVTGSVYVMDEAGAAGDYTSSEPGVLITLIYKARARR